MIEVFHKRYSRKLGRSVQKTLQSSLSILKKPRISCEVYFFGDEDIRALNRRFRKKNKATNVLAFPLSKDFLHAGVLKNYLGEIYLAPHYIGAHKENIHYLAIHGLLHLLGYTHNSSRDKMEMERMEKSLMKKIFGAHSLPR